MVSVSNAVNSTPTSAAYFTGAESCYDEDTISPISGKSISELYRLTLYRRQQLKNLYPDFELVEVWEHDLEADLERATRPREEKYRRFPQYGTSGLQGSPLRRQNRDQ